MDAQLPFKKRSFNVVQFEVIEGQSGTGLGGSGGHSKWWSCRRNERIGRGGISLTTPGISIFEEILQILRVMVVERFLSMEMRH